MKQTIQNNFIEERHLQRLLKIFQTNIDSKKARVYLFGSRANRSYRKSSDIDLAVKSSEISPIILSHIREDLHESHIPYKVDLIDFNEVNESLKKEIQNEGILIWES